METDEGGVKDWSFPRGVSVCLSMAWTSECVDDHNNICYDETRKACLNVFVDVVASATTGLLIYRLSSSPSYRLRGKIDNVPRTLLPATGCPSPSNNKGYRMMRTWLHATGPNVPLPFAALSRASATRQCCRDSCMVVRGFQNTRHDTWVTC
jgi:hypothetical protein